MRIAALALFVIAATGGVAIPARPATAQGAKQAPPYWRSIGPGRALMRTGPARTYPAAWLYQRRDLPLRVVAVFKEWRRVQDPDGAEGWMLSNLLRTTRTAIVRGEGPAAMRKRPAADAATVWQAAPGVVGRISDCAGGGWCRFDVEGRTGYIPIERLWGVEQTEMVE
jgi:SH3-like domain-containing protein